jgi:molybdenum cofactor biosynthesis protein B
VSAREHRSLDAGIGPVRFGVVTVSDTRSAADDLGGAEACSRIAAAGFVVTTRRIVADEVTGLREVARELVAPDAGLDAVVFTGGTGFSPRDVSVEALAPLFDQAIDGFGELFRMLSFAEIGAAAMLSRASAGIIAGVPVFLLPGSPAAVLLGLERLVLPELRHLLGQLRRSATRVPGDPHQPRSDRAT